MKKPTLEKFAKMCELKAGNITEIAKALNVSSRQTIYTWMETDEAFKEAYDNIEESILDFTESQLYNLIKGIPKIEIDEDGQKKFVGWIERPSEAAIFFKLKTRGKKRGYVEKSEVSNQHSGEIVITRKVIGG